MELENCCRRPPCETGEGGRRSRGRNPIRCCFDIPGQKGKRGKVENLTSTNLAAFRNLVDFFFALNFSHIIIFFATDTRSCSRLLL